MWIASTSGYRSSICMYDAAVVPASEAIVLCLDKVGWIDVGTQKRRHLGVREAPVLSQIEQPLKEEREGQEADDQWEQHMV